MLKLWRALLCQLAINITYHIVKANLCLGGHDIYATVRENSPTGAFVANLSIVGEPGASSIRLCLTGDNADWFYLEGKSIRLNTSFSRALDREVQGSVLIAALTCYEGETVQSEYRIMVEILNENDNKPIFLEQTVQPFNISELTEVNSVVFSVQANDADDDTIMYVIDTTLPDASYFKIDLPNSGKVVLAKPLDYETKTRLQFVIYAVEMNTKERYNTSANVMVNVLEGDDQYPQFLPCTPLSQDQRHPICANPVYIVNITEKEQDTVLYFSPGPIHAVDGDRGLLTPVLYTILSGADNGRFRINNETGEVVLTRRVENRLLTPTLRLRIMASQRDDPKKYSVATALIRVLAENRFPPQFNRTTYKGFITVDSSPATLVNTYGNTVLVIQAIDRDFENGMNPKVHYSLSPDSNNTGLYHITQEGLLIARTNQLRAYDKHFLQVLATDQESGEEVKASIEIEVLQKGQPVPHSPFGEERLYGNMDMSAAGGVAIVVLLILVAALFLFLQLAKRRRQRQDPAERASVAQGKHPNVVNHGRPIPPADEVCYHNEAFGDYDASRSVLHGKHGVYTRKDSTAPIWAISRDYVSHEVSPVLLAPEPPTQNMSPLIVSNGGASNKSSKSVSFKDEVVLGETGVTQGERSGYVEVHSAIKEANDSTAHTPQEASASQSHEAEKTEDTSDDSSEPQGGDTSEELEKQESESEDEEIPENPYNPRPPVQSEPGRSQGYRERQAEDPALRPRVSSSQPGTAGLKGAENKPDRRGKLPHDRSAVHKAQTGLKYSEEDSIKF